jgi:hypothetical protein
MYTAAKMAKWTLLLNLQGTHMQKTATKAKVYTTATAAINTRPEEQLEVGLLIIQVQLK